MINKTNQLKLYRNSMYKITYFTVCLLLIGLSLSCGVKDKGGTSPIPGIEHDSLGISSFSVLDGNKNPVSESDTNAIPIDASFSLIFDRHYENMTNYTNYLASQIELSDIEGGGPIDLSIETSLTSQIEISTSGSLSYGATYQVVIKKGLTIGNYQVTNDITYTITTKKSSDSSLVIIYNNEEILPNGDNITIVLPAGSDESSVAFTLKVVGVGAILQDGNDDDLPLNGNNQYTTNMDFSGDKKYDFTVIAQDGNTSTAYSIGVLLQQADSKEIVSFAFLQSDNLHLKNDIAMDINSQNITKTVTNVEGITGLTPYIVHSGSDISPASGMVQNFSTDNIYTVTAIDQTTSDYTVTLTSYYGVTINTNGGLITGAPTTTKYVLYEGKISRPSDNPSQEHYGFKGWYDAPSGGSVFAFNAGITSKTIVYARWTNKQYRVSFDTDGGSAIESITTDSLTPVIKPSDPTKEHYSSLEGWYVDNSFTTRYDFNWVVSNDFTLYAKYINKQYQVRFYYEGSLLNTVSATSLTAIPAFKYPAYPDVEKKYKWYSDTGLTQIYDKSSQVIGNFDLYAEVIPSLQKIIEDGTVPTDLINNYGKVSESIFSRYTAGATVVARYIKETASGTGNGSSWANAGGDIKVMIDGIGDAGNNKVYVVLIASGTYKPNYSYAMRNHVALVGGFTAGSYERVGETRLDGNNYRRVFDNDSNGLDQTALLYGVIITNGKADNMGGGMHNQNSSPTLINVTFSGNKVNDNGGGIGNNSASPTLINVIFSDNDGGKSAGGMYNWNSIPTLINVTFFNNKAATSGGGVGGGMVNSGSSPTLINVTFSSNRAGVGGGMYNDGFSAPTLINVTFFSNTANYRGGGIYFFGDGQPTLINTVLWKNNNGNIYLKNDSTTEKSINLYYSLIQGGINASTTATGIRLYSDDTATHPVTINNEGIITDDPKLGILADNGGEVNTISIGTTSPAKDKGVYVKKKDSSRYYSIDYTAWFSDPGLTSLSSLPSDADDLTATDAREYDRIDRPDIGAYEVGGLPLPF